MLPSGSPVPAPQGNGICADWSVWPSSPHGTVVVGALGSTLVGVGLFALTWDGAWGAAVGWGAGDVASAGPTDRLDGAPGIGMASGVLVAAAAAVVDGSSLWD
ncbi:MAG: hypothetical protein JO148_11675 [Acidimicrobiia bacterium]|nr:hypothetical protein [Acidimicrobiia bacterium]